MQLKLKQNILDLLKRLPKDLKREIWSFLGFKSLETPSSYVFLDFLNTTSVQYECFGGKLIKRLKRDFYEEIYIDIEDNRESIELLVKKVYTAYIETEIPHLYYSQISYRNWLIFNEIMSKQKQIYESKYSFLDIKLLVLWEGRECCEVCDSVLEIIDLKLRKYQDWKCNACYSIDNGNIKIDELTNKECKNCESFLTGQEWKWSRKNYIHYCTPCWKDTMATDNSSDSETDD
jgi:hypothetical protein